jgi:hypothetical protein
MSQRMKQGRLPLGLPRVSSPRSSSAYAAFHATRFEYVAAAKRHGFRREDMSECSAQITTLPMEPQ